jgi:hypothetical protein
MFIESSMKIDLWVEGSVVVSKAQLKKRTQGVVGVMFVRCV